MDKLVERESAARNPLAAAPALAVQFFLIPLAVVGLAVIVYVGFRSLLADDRKAQDYLAEVRNGGSDRRWPAAYELSRLMADPTVRADRTLAPALVKAFVAAKEDDPRVRQYLALAIGRLDPPLPAEAVSELTKTLDSTDGETRISAIWALGSSGDAAVVPTLQPLYQSDDAGVRKMAVYALGALPGDAMFVVLPARSGIGAAGGRGAAGFTACAPGAAGAGVVPVAPVAAAAAAVAGASPPGTCRCCGVAAGLAPVGGALG